MVNEQDTSYSGLSEVAESIRELHRKLSRGADGPFEGLDEATIAQALNNIATSNIEIAESIRTLAEKMMQATKVVVSHQ